MPTSSNQLVALDPLPRVYDRDRVQRILEAAFRRLQGDERPAPEGSTSTPEPEDDILHWLL